MATMAALTTSKRFSGKRSRSRTSSIRGSPNLKSGSPIAADSPSTKIRTVLAGFSAGRVRAWGRRTNPGGKNRRPKSWLSVQTLRPSSERVRKKHVG